MMTECHNEMTEAIGVRAVQISNNPNDIFIPTSLLNTDKPNEIAKLEILKKCSPLGVRRFTHKVNGIEYYEDWDINELIEPNF